MFMKESASNNHKVGAFPKFHLRPEIPLSKYIAPFRILDIGQRGETEKYYM